MENSLIDRIIKIHLIMGATAACALGCYFGWIGGVAVFAGALWGSANLYMIKLLILNLFEQKRIDPLKVILAMMVKFPLVYLAGYGLLTTLPYQGLLLGFSSLFVVAFVLALRSIFSEGKFIKREAE